MAEISTVISIVLGICTLSGIVFAGYKWIIMQDIADKKQEDHYVELEKMVNQYKESVDNKIADMNSENMVVIYGLLACLDGLKQLGANGNVTQAYNNLENHLNHRAHE